MTILLTSAKWSSLGRRLFYCTNKRYDCAPKAVDQHVRKPPCAARDEELVEFVGAGVEEDDGESGEKTAFHVGGPIRKVQSKTDGAVKYEIFSHMSGFPDGEAHTPKLYHIPAQNANPSCEPDGFRVKIRQNSKAADG